MRKIIKYGIAGTLLASLLGLSFDKEVTAAGNTVDQRDLTVTHVAPTAEAQKGVDKKDNDQCCEKAVKETDVATDVSGLQPLPSIPDIIMVDQDGRAVHIASDILKGKITVINFIYTSCKSVCQILTNNFRQIEDRLDAIDSDGKVQLVSISIDPEIDTPPRLRQYAMTQRIDLSKWTLLVSGSNSTERLSRALGFSNVDKATHAPGVVIWDDIDKSWQRFVGITPPHVVLKELGKLPAMSVN